MSFTPAAYGTVLSVYGEAAPSATEGSSSYLDMASQYTPLIKSLLFDEDPRIAYAKKSQELQSAIASYKVATSTIAKNALTSKIRSLQAELQGLSAQSENLSTSEALSTAGKATAVGLLVAGIGAVSLVGYFLYQKAATEKAKQRQIASGRE